jgi:hypothetical protein
MEMSGDQRSAIYRVHNEYDGLMGFHLTMLKKGQVWANMRQNVQKYISQCPTCQKLRVLNPSNKAPYVTAAPQPMERISIDTIGPLKTFVWRTHRCE